MQSLKWNSRYNLGIARIDSQHKMLVEEIGKLQEAMAKGNANKVVSRTIDALHNYAKTHFREEEEMLRKAGFPELSDHRRYHNSFLEKIEQMKDDYESGKSSITIRLNNFLGNWMISHIENIDRQYLKYLDRKKVKV